MIGVVSSVTARTDSTPEPQAASLRKPVAEFEATLIAQVLEKLRDAYRLPGVEETDVAGDSLRSLATSALAGGLSRSGGFGIGRLLMNELENMPEVTSPGVKPMRPGADYQLVTHPGLKNFHEVPIGRSGE